MRNPSANIVASFPAQSGYEVVLITDDFEVDSIEPCIGFVVVDTSNSTTVIKPVTLEKCFAKTSWERFAIKQPDGRVQYSNHGKLEGHESIDAFRLYLEAWRAELATDADAPAIADTEAA